MYSKNKIKISLLYFIFLTSIISAAPQISDVTINPENPEVADIIEICANIFDNSTISIVRINLKSEIPLWNWGLIMDKISENKYCKTLSPLLMKSYEDKTIKYYIYVRNILGEITSTEDFYYTYKTNVYIPPEYVCGNNIKEPGEECDNGELNGIYDISNLNFCSSNCKKMTIIPERSGSKSSNSKIKISNNFCEVNWKCSEWSDCNNKIMTRNCYDKSNCDHSYDKPDEKSICEMSNNFVYKQEFDLIKMLSFIFIALFIILILIFIVGRR